MKLQIGFDKALALTVFFLIGLGVVQVYSSSFIFSTEKFGDGLYFFKRQFLFSILSIIVLISVAMLPWKYLKILGIAIWGICLVGVILTFFPGLAVSVGGANRWLQLPFGIRFEPSEGLKVCYPFIISYFIFWKTKLQPRWKNSIIAITLFCPFILLIKQPDFGSLVISAMVILTVYFVFGLSIKYLVGGLTVASTLFVLLIITSSYRLARVEAFLNPWSDPTNKGFQLIQSILSVHSGGMFGKGLGQGQAKLFFLPEAHTDFTFAIFAEEWGFLGVSIVLLLYGYVLFRGLRISAQCQNPQGRAVAIGVTTVFALNVFINLAVVFGLVPPKGLTLPFMSYGGSSLLMMSFAIGVLLCISRQMNLSDGFNNQVHGSRFYKIM